MSIYTTVPNNDICLISFGYTEFSGYQDSSAYILLTKTTAARNGVALSYRSVRGLYFLAVVFVRRIMWHQHMLMAARLKKGTAQLFRLTNSARIFINLCWYYSSRYNIAYINYICMN